MFNKVLVATNKPLECDESVLSATRIGKHYNAKLLILNVLESDSSIYRNYVKHYRTGEEIVCNEAYKEKVKKELYKNCSGDLTAVKKFKIRIALGVPYLEILRWAREEHVDLIVLGAYNGKADSEEKTGAYGTVGSTAEGVIKHERCPVLIVSNPILERKVTFEKIMVSIDFSPSCSSALQFAVDLAQKRRSKLYLFHMLPVSPQPKYDQAKYDADIREVRQKLEELSIEIPDAIEVEIETWGGVYPDIEILKYARQNDVDLIAMGSHTKLAKKTGGSKWYVGSAVERVSSKSICPTIIITDPKVIAKWKE